jgi:hypothetical protein
MKKVTGIHTTSMIAASALLFNIAGLSHAADNEPVIIPPEAAVHESAVKPLTVAYYNFQKVRPLGTPGIDSIDIAKAFVKDREPDAEVTIPAAQIDFPVGPERTMPSGGTVGKFLLGEEEMAKLKDANKLPTGFEVPMNSRNIFVFNGYFKVAKPGTYEFRVPADDGGELTIGGVVVHVNSPGSGMYAATHSMYLARATFEKPGIYPLKLVYFDKARDMGVDLYSDVNPRGEFRELGDSPGAGLVLLPFMK